jgi:hypothetical protein
VEVRTTQNEAQKVVLQILEVVDSAEVVVCDLGATIDDDVAMLPDRNVLTIDTVTTRESYRGRGYATAAIQSILAAYPDAVFKSSPDSANSEAGRALLTALRERGDRLHEFECFRGTSPCGCVLGAP